MDCSYYSKQGPYFLFLTPTHEITNIHQVIYLIYSDFGGLGIWCQGFFYFNRTKMNLNQFPD
jgi:hypothetical protein